jgi:hypothetical protein
MKYIKAYEKIEDVDYIPQVGDFVICDEQTSNDKELKDFINNTIGECLGSNSKNKDDDNLKLYSVKYDDIPYWQKLQNNFTPYPILRKEGRAPKYYFRNFYRREMKHVSKNKEELEALLAQNKYNL